MAAYRVIIGDVESPILSFENATIESIEEVNSVAVIGDELAIDQFLPVVRYHVELRYVFKPTNYDQFVSSDGLVLCGHYNYNLRTVPYGTKVTFYADENIIGIYNIENVERTGMDTYQLNCVSDVGLMDKQPHKGGIYTGQLFEDVLVDILGGEYAFSVTEDVAQLRIYGWLPYATRRQNLHQLLMAYGVNIIKSSQGTMLFTFLVDTEPTAISTGRTYNEGSVNYGAPASKVDVLEHAYYYLSTTAEEQLYDNTATGAEEQATVIFSHPIYPDSITATDGLEVLEKGVNYAVVSGSGILTGKPYTHNARLISVENPDAVTEKVVTVEDATLVTLANSDNVSARLGEYYFNATVVTGSIVASDERCGVRYAVYNAFREYVNGFMAKMTSRVSGIIKAECEFIADYIPKGLGSTYNTVRILSAASGTWKVPAEVFEKEQPLIRVVLIGKGRTGSPGSDGASGEKASASTPGKGGEGGAGGAGGAGGDIFVATLDCTGISSFTYARSGHDTTFKGGSYNLSSADGAPSDTGFVDIFSGQVYALPGKAGQAGADGGKGGRNRHASTATVAEDGDAVTYNGRTYSGGAGADLVTIYGADAGISHSMRVFTGVGAGGGAAVGSSGGAAPTAENAGGDGADAGAADAALSVYGSGGNGGHGGGGSGGGGCEEWWNADYSSVIAQYGGHPGTPGAGSDGSEGYQGCAIIYY